MPSEDLGASAYRKYDIEAWMPSRNSYGEISSTSNCTDYQSRRLNIKYRLAAHDNQFTHTLNGTACATSRVMLALLENYQQKDGTVVIPEPLRPFMGGVDKIAYDIGLSTAKNSNPATLQTHVLPSVSAFTSLLVTI
jgi:seryl-tRNA synthetase